MMIKLTCLCILFMAARALAKIEEIACCAPEEYLSLKKFEDRAVCYTLKNNETTSTSIDCQFGHFHYKYEKFNFTDDKVIVIGIENTHVTDRYCVHDLYSPQMNITAKYGIICLDPPAVEINGYIFIVSVVFLIMTVIIYAAFRELRDLYGKSFINLCGSLAIGLGIFAIISLMGQENGDMNLCAIRGFLAYYFLLVSFFWTTAISFQLLFSIRSPSNVNQGWNTLARYALFAWGCPAVITICMAVVNFHPGDHAKPGIGIRTCWFDLEEAPQIHYWLYSVLAVLISVNILIFIYITFIFCRHHFATKQIASLKQRFGMAVKLFTVMGLYWIVELVSQFGKEDHIVWKILSGVTSLQGLWIFLAWVVFRKRAVKAMHKRGWLSCISGPVEKYLYNYHEDDDEQTIEHTTVPMEER